MSISEYCTISVPICPTITRFARFKDLADKKHGVFNDNWKAWVNETEAAGEENKYVYVESRVVSETGEKPEAHITVAIQNKESQATAQGSGPVDAIFRAIESVVNSGASLLLYSVNNVTDGTDSQGETTVRLSRGGHVVNGNGADTDVIIASAKAYINALNKLEASIPREHPQRGDV